MKTDTIEGLTSFMVHGVPPGDFLRAVLKNDLMGAMGKADEQNRNDIFEICKFVYNEMPHTCHGSAEAVDEWIKTKAAERATLEKEK
jgi:hypothetical protein